MLSVDCTHDRENLLCLWALGFGQRCFRSRGTAVGTGVRHFSMGPSDSATGRGRKAVQFCILGPGNLGEVGTPGHGGGSQGQWLQVSLTVRGSL